MVLLFASSSHGKLLAQPHTTFLHLKSMKVHHLMVYLVEYLLIVKTATQISSRQIIHAQTLRNSILLHKMLMDEHNKWLFLLAGHDLFFLKSFISHIHCHNKKPYLSLFTGSRSTQTLTLYFYYIISYDCMAMNNN